MGGSGVPRVGSKRCEKKAREEPPRAVSLLRWELGQEVTWLFSQGRVGVEKTQLVTRRERPALECPTLTDVASLTSTPNPKKGRRRKRRKRRSVQRDPFPPTSLHLSPPWRPSRGRSVGMPTNHPGALQLGRSVC